jgi:GNAT superfamily N-acetyltransferase
VNHCKVVIFSGDKSMHLRPLNPASAEEITLIANRMRDTLIEVEGEARGASMYTQEWLESRVRWHLDGEQVCAQVIVACDADGLICGHTIYRIEQNAEERFGLISTTYVLPTHRQTGIASCLLQSAHDWFLSQGIRSSNSWTSSSNARLIALYQKHGYTIAEQGPNDLTGTLMVRLSVQLSASGIC